MADRPLRFGMTLDEVASIVKPYADLRDTFVCNTAWAKRFTCDDLQLVLFADEADALFGVSASHRHGQGTPHVPVGLDDVDLFGWPVDEVVDALRHAGRDVREAKHSARVGRDLHRTWVPPATPAPTPFLNDLCLYAPR